MERISVDSSNLRSVGYDLRTSTLEVEFTNGSVYQYFDVPESVHEGLISSGSKGQYFNSFVKGVYRYARL